MATFWHLGPLLHLSGHLYPVQSGPQGLEVPTHSCLTLPQAGKCSFLIAVMVLGGRMRIEVSIFVSVWASDMYLFHFISFHLAEGSLWNGTFCVNNNPLSLDLASRPPDNAPSFPIFLPPKNSVPSCYQLGRERENVWCQSRLKQSKWIWRSPVPAKGPPYLCGCEENCLEPTSPTVTCGNPKLFSIFLFIPRASPLGLWLKLLNQLPLSHTDQCWHGIQCLLHFLSLKCKNLHPTHA